MSSTSITGRSPAPAGALRIGLVGPLPPPAGGMANQTVQLARLLRAEGHQVELIQVNAACRPAWAGRLKGIRAVVRLLPFVAALWRAAGRQDLFHVMANSGLSWHLYAAPAIWIGRLRGCPVVINYRGGEAGTFLDAAEAWIRPSLVRADALIVPSGFLGAVFGKFGFAATIVPNIVNLERFSAAPAPAARPLSLLVARNLEPIYDNATALRAFAIVRQAHPLARLVVAGCGPERERLERLAAELAVGSAVTFAGRLDPDQMAALYRGADVMLNPSLVDNMPNSVLEALASGVLVVSTNVGGVPYMVDDGSTALLVPPASPQAMADAVLRLLSDAALAEAMRAAGLRCAQQYTWDSVRPRLLQVYRTILAKSTSTAAIHS